MEDAWKVLGREVPPALLRVATSEQALASLDAALAELDVRVEMAHELCLGPMAAALAARARSPRPDGITPAALLQDARAEVLGLSATHGGVARVFDLYRGHVGDAVERALGEAIDAHRSATARGANEALDSLLAAAAHSEAASDVYAVAQGVPYGSPTWGGWTAAAENLARLVFQDATAARGAVTRMLDGVAHEFFAVWMLIKATEKEPWKRLARSAPETLELVATLGGVMQELRSLQSRLEKLQAQLYVKTCSDSSASGSSAPAVIAVLEAAHREITRVMALHAAAGHVFTMCATHLDVECDTVRRWDSYRTDAVRAGHETMRRMGCAASAWMVLDEMLSGAQSAKFRRAEAKQLLRQAGQGVGNARDALRRMRDAVALQYSYEHSWRPDPSSAT